MRTLERRMAKLEARANQSKRSENQVFLVPWGQWPEDENGMRALVAEHPMARIIFPETAPSAEAWMAQAGRNFVISDPISERQQA